MRGEGAVAKSFSQRCGMVVCISSYGLTRLEGLAERQVNVMHSAFFAEHR